MFDLDRFVEDCRSALSADRTHKSMREVVARAVADPAGVIAGIGEPRRAEVQKLYHAPDLTILNVIWAPGMTIRPHNHLMWAVIGIYTGRENNIFWRRLPGDAGDSVMQPLNMGVVTPQGQVAPALAPATPTDEEGGEGN